MSLDLLSIPDDARARYVGIGKQFGCAEVVEQADRTIHAAEQFRDQISQHGFIDPDLDRLKQAKQLLIERMYCVDPARVERRTSRQYVDAIRAGKQARQRARSILYIVAQRLTHSGDPMSVEAARAVSATLQQTESSRGDPARLAAQLDLLRATLLMPRVDRAASERGGVGAATQLVTAAEQLRASARGASPGGPSTESGSDLDLLCGLIVEVTRDARRAARSAARAFDQVALASAFELTGLYGPTAAVGGESGVPSVR